MVRRASARLTVLFHLLVQFSLLERVVECVAQPIASPLSDADLQCNLGNVLYLSRQDKFLAPSNLNDKLNMHEG